ncbi:site-specific integrase, partial [Chryseobacterium koreense]|uniref:tyrosine-type recombinase/integrase n=1 Tax=Chryseobacterium koreense TaxID=232216 RepID=UPI0026E924EF
MNSKKTFAQIATLWKNDKKMYVKRSTFSAYILLLENHLLPPFGEYVEEITETVVQEFVFQKLNQGLSQKSIKDVLIVMRMVLKFGAKHKLLTYTPFDIQYPTVRESQSIEVLSKTNQKKIMNYIQQHFTFRNLGVYICLSSGIRIGEICALAWEDIDTDNSVIHVRKTIQRIYMIEDGIRKTELLLDTPKTKNSIREIPMSRDLLRMLKPFKKIVNPA